MAGFELESSATFLAIKRCLWTNIWKVIKLAQSVLKSWAHICARRGKAVNDSYVSQCEILLHTSYLRYTNGTLASFPHFIWCSIHLLINIISKPTIFQLIARTLFGSTQLNCMTFFNSSTPRSLFSSNLLPHDHGHLPPFTHLLHF